MSCCGEIPRQDQPELSGNSANHASPTEPRTSGAVSGDALRTMVMRALGILLLYGSTTAIAAVLGDQQFGEYSSALGLAMLLAAVAPLGTDRVLVRTLSVKSDPAEQRREIITAHQCLLSTICVLLPLVIGCGFVLGRLGLPEWQRTVWLSGLMFPPLALTWLRQWVALPLVGSFSALVPEQILIPLGSIAGLAISAAARGSVRAEQMAALNTGLMLLVWAATTRSRRLRPAFSGLLRDVAGSFDRPAVSLLFMAGIPFLLVAVGGILCQRCMPLVVAAGGDFADAAVFSYGMMVAGAASLPLGILNVSLVPQFARLWRDHDIDAANHLAREAATMTGLTGLVLGAAIWIFWPVLLLLCGPDYAGVTGLLPWLLAAVLLDCMTGPTIPVMQTMDLERNYGQLLLVHTPVQLVLMYLGCLWWSVEGAAIAYLIGRGIWNLAIVELIRRRRSLLLMPSIATLRSTIELVRRFCHRRGEDTPAVCGSESSQERAA